MIKKVALAIAMLGVSSSAFAAIQLGDSTASPQGDGELIMVAFKAGTNVTYVFDLTPAVGTGGVAVGDRINSWLDNPGTAPNAASNSTFNLPKASFLTPGFSVQWQLPKWNDFVAANGNDVSGTEFIVLGSDFHGLSNQQQSYRAVATHNTASTVNSLAGLGMTGANVISFGSGTQTFIGAHNALQTPGNTDDASIYVRNPGAPVITQSADFFAGVDRFGRASLAFDNKGTIDDAAGVSFGYFANTGATLPAGLFRRFENVHGDAIWTLSSTGTLAFTAPVPEPESYALMLAGLALVGAVARRSKK